MACGRRDCVVWCDLCVLVLRSGKSGGRWVEGGAVCHMGRFGEEVIFLAEDDEFSLGCRKEEGLVRCSNEDVK